MEYTSSSRNRNTSDFIFVKLEDDRDNSSLNNIEDYCDYETINTQEFPETSKIKCDTYKYNSKKWDFEVEVKIERLQTTYKCIMCNYTTSQKGHYNRHIKTHTGHKVYRCDLCNYEAGEASCLKKHKRTHTGEKPYQCDYCGKTFRQLSSMSCHMKTHTPEICYTSSLNSQQMEVLTPLKLNRVKAFACDECEYKTAYRSDLTDHKRTHTREKPYECKECGYRTVRSSHLKRHVKKHNKVKLYKCKLCNYQTNFPNAYNSHLKKCVGDVSSSATLKQDI